MNMIERVARAICAALYDCQPDSVIADEEWEGLIGEARAAIEAMREPSEAMIASQIGDCPVNIGRQWLRDDAYSTWTAMIDAALLEAA